MLQVRGIRVHEALAEYIVDITTQADRCGAAGAFADLYGASDLARANAKALDVQLEQDGAALQRTQSVRRTACYIPHGLPSSHLRSPLPAAQPDAAHPEPAAARFAIALHIPQVLLCSQLWPTVSTHPERAFDRFAIVPSLSLTPALLYTVVNAVCCSVMGAASCLSAPP